MNRRSHPACHVQRLALKQTYRLVRLLRRHRLRRAAGAGDIVLTCEGGTGRPAFGRLTTFVHAVIDSNAATCLNGVERSPRTVSLRAGAITRVFPSVILSSLQRSHPVGILSFLLQLGLGGCGWSLLSGVAEAAEYTHEYVGGELVHSLGLRLHVIMAALWVFVLGSCIGSFLNVVIYRLPAGMALSRPGSRCPVCETELTARDNIPILGWLMLKGRCRYCQVAISPRYPLIELTVGLLFLGLLLVESCSGATNLPLRESHRSQLEIFDAIFRQGQWELLGWFTGHAFYLTLVLALGMIGFDGHKPPRRLVFTGTAAALVFGIFWPSLRPVHYVVRVPELLDQFWGIQWSLPRSMGGQALTTGISLTGFLDGVTGAGSGLLTGWLAARPVSRHHNLAATVRGVFLLAGVWCGWQMTWPLLTIVLIATAALQLLAPGRLPASLALVLSACCTALLFGWDLLMNGVFLIRYDGWQWTGMNATFDWVVTIGLLTGAALGLSRLVTSDTSEKSGSWPT